MDHGQQRMQQLATSAIADGRPLAWYDQLYAEAGEVPWDHREPTPYLVEWLAERFPGDPPRGRAVVVGCAFGDDAELVARHGFTTTAFDISSSAIRAAQRRHPDSPVHYCRADLLDLPADWDRHFDLVIECTTLQCLPPQLHREAAGGIASLCAPGGMILVVARVPTPDDPPGPPWLLTEDEVRDVATDGVDLINLARLPMRGGERWVAELTRSTG
ncbi:class I SAM-dependent methyltransferase [Microlunatus soli]|uniref:Thiopurine S-methyltransferase (TPMT) n=1 Tax=Microlunatus soli TaxID=630515 RepID=A0A1H1TRW4_9ACTN|nr:class I SAM-dependent methyltransferase [Microlunatus soli]SDS62958.1 Thiopurine S-methyltransferase (TPMT) [Microlunatus soli]